ncbi:MAG: GNVR domain-containing protein [Calditrichia bacterium]
MNNDNASFDPVLYYVALRKRFRAIIVNTILVSVLAVILVLVLPKTFTSQATILPPVDEGGLFGSLSLNLPVAGILGGIGDASGSMNKFIAIVKSRKMAESVIENFDLMTLYESSDIEEAMEGYYGSLDYFMDEEEMLHIAFSVETSMLHPDDEEAEAKQLSSEVTNFIVNKLNEYNVSLETQKATYNRLLIEKRFDLNKVELAAAEDSLRKFSEDYGIFSLPEQVEASIARIAELETQVVIKEVELNTLRQLFQNENSQIRQKKLEVQALRIKLKDLQQGTPHAKGAAPALPAFKRLPELGLDYLRLRRNVEVQNLLYEFFAKQYEQIKLQEMNDTPTLQVLDVAVPPIKKSSPKRGLIVILAAATAFVIGCFLALIADPLLSILARGKKMLTAVDDRA